MGLQDLRYETDLGLIAQIRMGDEEAAVAGDEPAGDVDLPVHVLNSGSRRAFGFHPRTVVLRQEVGEDPNTFNRYRDLAVLTPTAFGEAGFALGAEIELDGTTWEVSRRIPETSV